ncbi:MAG: hypothetical protein U1A78_25075 [Polyangia bacterium]
MSLISVLLGLLAGAARGAEPTAAAYTSQAIGLVAQGDFAGARDAYQAAYRLSHKPELLLNIGRCQHYLKHYDEALASYEVYQELVASPPPELVQKVQKFRTEATEARASLIARLAIPTAPPAQRPLYKQGWFWGLLAEGAGLVAAGGLVIGLSLRGGPEAAARCEPALCFTLSK